MVLAMSIRTKSPPAASSTEVRHNECCTQGVIKGVGDWEELLALTSVAERSVVRFEQEVGSSVTCFHAFSF